MKAKHNIVRFTARLVLLFAFATGGRLYAQDFDWGDAPDAPYPTFAASTGAVHQIQPGMFLGGAIDPEQDGQPNANADLDDLDVQGDDEDGVTFDTALIPGQPAQITVTANMQGILDAWLDFNANGVWESSELLGGASIPLNAGPNVIPFTVPAGSPLGLSYARFRFSPQGNLPPDNIGIPIPEGEVEDYLITIEEEFGELIDWGDAPDLPYPTLAANNGASHVVDAAVYLGFGVDAETNGQPHVSAMGDDANLIYLGIGMPPGDEDGVTFTSLLAQGQMASVSVVASTAGVLNAWFDFDADGIWTPAEEVISTAPVVFGPNTFNFSVPFGATVGPTYTRFRFALSTNAYVNGIPAPAGPATDGEVEDYRIWIESENIDTNKMHWPQYPDPDGWDVQASFNEETGIQKVLADDFLCTSNGLITHITFWGSWFFDEFEAQHPYQGITNIHLSLHSDQPDPDGYGGLFSMPSNLLWWADIDPLNPPPGWIVSEPIAEEPSWQGWYDPNINEVIPLNHTNYFRYEIEIPAEEAFYQTNGTIYWLDISVNTLQGMWGWKTSRSPHFNDDAVWQDEPVHIGFWNELLDPIYSNSLDLAFIIDGPVDEEEPQEELDWGDAPDSPQGLPPTYNTLSANSGANHLIVQGLYLGAYVDPEPDGQPTPAADGDDLDAVYFSAGDDEDGITLPAHLTPNGTCQFTVTASTGGGWLAVWFDSNGNGVWDHPGEMVFNGTIPGSSSVQSFGVPTTTPTGQNYLRFRFTSGTSAYTGGAPVPTGNATDGEVEDYTIDVVELDWGDAPDDGSTYFYPTLNASVGANHIIVGGTANALRLGSSIDHETDGQPLPPALGDDNNGMADEDGITFLHLLYPGTWAQIDVVASIGSGSGTAYLQAWIDYNADGDWLDTGEQIFTDEPVTYSGVGTVNTLSFLVSTNYILSGTTTYARFRLSTQQGIGRTGQAPDGEVEDYEITLEPLTGIDWGDAQDAPYFTLSGSTGAHHVIVSGMYLGSSVDPDPDGQPTLSANGDDSDGNDDEEGVLFKTLPQRGGYVHVDVIASTSGVLDAWVDFNTNGVWAEANEQIFNNQALVTGINSLFFPVPLMATENVQLPSRFRFVSSAAAYPGGVVSYTGLALDGEVEDHLTHEVVPLALGGTDWGDAIEPPYHTTTNGFNGARHTIVAGYILGSSIDAEMNGQPDIPAEGDDNTGLADDEDGVTFLDELVAGSNVNITVVAGTLGGFLDAWIDLDQGGTWAAFEKLGGGSIPLAPGPNLISVTVPGLPAQALGPTYARFRLSSTGGLTPTGPAINGEVEDYRVELRQPAPTSSIVITNQTFDASYAVTTNEWTVENGIIYQMESNTNLLTGPWIPAGATKTGPVNWQTDSISGDDVKFYRVVVPFTP